ncbi:MAG TPA: DUF222 domain-containing protein [Gaiella sp.]|nr:DUF222 domain-containing protein [Gaiella sp.]
METTRIEIERAKAQERYQEERRRVDELATLSAHLSAATARMLELVWTMHEKGDVDGGELAGFLAFRCGITGREAREYLRVAEALHELPATRAAFSRGELTFTKVRALTRVATATSEERLLELAGALTASQLERALRVYRRITVDEARETHEVEYVDYHFDEDGSLYLRARLAAEDGTVLVKALDAARERVFERRRHERAAAECEADARDTSMHVDGPERPVRVEALAEVAQAALAATDEPGLERARLVVHVDADALTVDGRGRSELEDGPVICPETARRLGCDAELVAQVERDGLPVSVGRKRRTVPPALRRLLEARDDETCCFPGCERTRHLQAHHRRHWAAGGETSLDNLVLLCFHHHRLVHEGGYTVEDDGAGRLRFRNRSGVLTANLPPRPPPAWAGELLAENDRMGLEIGPRTNQNGGYHPFDLGAAVSAVSSAFT